MGIGVSMQNRADSTLLIGVLGVEIFSEHNLLGVVELHPGGRHGGVARLRLGLDLVG